MCEHVPFDEIISEPLGFNFDPEMGPVVSPRLCWTVMQSRPAGSTRDASEGTVPVLEVPDPEHGIHSLFVGYQREARQYPLGSAIARCVTLS
jgi:hypothetical protein